MDGARLAQGIVVRQLGVADAPRYRALRIEGLRRFPFAFRSDYGEALGQPLAWSQQRLSTPGEYWFGAFDGEELVGAVGLRTSQSPKIRHVATLAALIVDGDRHGQRIGSALVAHLVAFARSLGHVRQVQLGVIEGNTRAIRLYEAFGFEQYGRAPGAVFIDGRYHADQQRQLFL